jgi:hypothetical protein
MELLSRTEFLTWAAAGGLAPDAAGGAQSDLVFPDNDQCLVWRTPAHTSDIPGFVSSLMRALGEAGPFTLGLRAGAPWFTHTAYGEGPLVEQIRDRIVGTLPIPREFNAAVRLTQAEWRDVMMVFATFLEHVAKLDQGPQIVPTDERAG